MRGATEDALFRRLVTPEALWRVVDGADECGRDGSGVLRQLLLERDPSWAATESPLEDAIVDILRQYGEPEPVRQHVIDGPAGKKIRLDTTYPWVLINIEGDGLRWHSGSGDRQRDHERDNYLTSIGWAVLRFTWDDVRHRPEAIPHQVGGLRRARERLAG